MNISFLLLKDFRNYRHLELRLEPGVSLFFGRNASGKTNLLEACYYLSSLTSVRAERDHDLCRWGAKAFAAGCRVDDDGSSKTIKVQVAVEPALRRKVTVDDVPVRRSELIRVLPAVYFSPDDLYMIKRSSASRRKFLDSLLGRIDPEYARRLSRYQDALARRNNVLKKIRSDPSWRRTLESLDGILVEAGSMVTARRLTAMGDLQREVSETYAFIAGRPCGVSYASSIGVGEVGGDLEDISRKFEESLQAKREEETARGITLSGPHRDDIVLTLGGKEVRYFGSQGEQRSAALALKLAEAKMLEGAFGRKPVLLLDDVLSELDEYRRKKVLSLCDYGHQILITATDPIEDLAPDVTEFRVQDGSVEPYEGGGMA
ncbi:MAG TPA: DNA replication/repair protein RecF [Firmicutes bacterium]|nr:DNA replication/repair protein RecF [Candidatus Fermentithermobacillaceae bacterium]